MVFLIPRDRCSEEPTVFLSFFTSAFPFLNLPPIGRSMKTSGIFRTILSHGRNPPQKLGKFRSTKSAKNTSFMKRVNLFKYIPHNLG
jgi:hypothetical protein